MSTITKALLFLAIANLLAGFAFVTDLVSARGIADLYVTLPAGAIFSGLFMICRVLDKETARYNAEQKAILARTASAAPLSSATESHPIAQPVHSHAH